MSADSTSSRRDLVARVATLELVVADLIEVLWRLDPAAMERQAQEARRDLETHDSRSAPAGAEHQRDRLRGVLQDRRRRLEHRRRPRGAARS